MKEETFWRSLGELNGDDEFKKHLELELPGHDTVNPSSIERRRFMQLMGASVALAGLQSCRWDVEKIMPMAQRQAGTTPGVPRRFATSMEMGGVGHPLLVTSYDGRPTKIEGNPLHGASLGAADVFSQASILGLCDPERVHSVWGPTKGDEGKRASNWEEFAQAMGPVFERLKGQGQKLAFLSEASSSVTVAALRKRVMTAFPGASWTSYESAGYENLKKGAEMAFGQPFRAHYDLEKAKVIVALDADLFGDHPDHQSLSRGWAAGRDPKGGSMNRFYAVESQFSSTGASADNRLALKSSLIGSFAASLLDRVEGKGSAASESAEVKKFLQAIHEDLVSNRGAAVVIAGPNQPAAVQALAHQINAKLGAVGKTVTYTLPAWDNTGPEGLAALTRRMDGGEVDTLVVLGGNPVYDAPADIDFGAALAKVAHSAHLSLHDNETARRCHWVLPQTHFLESWGDARAWDGSITLAQPLIAPLYPACKTVPETLALVLGDKAPKSSDLVKSALKEQIGAAGFDGIWRKSLHDGFVGSSNGTLSTPTARALPAGALERKPLAVEAAGKGEYEITFTACTKVHDGRFANNGWLQELPDYMTKLTWDNALNVSPNTAVHLDLETGDMVELELSGRKLKVAIHVMPGQATNSLGLSLGYGRTEAGSIGGSKAEGIDPVGFDASAIRTSVASAFATGVKLTKLAETHKLATTQEHFAIDDKLAKEGLDARLGALVRSTDLEHYKKHPDFAKHVVHHPPLISPFEEQSYDATHQWGMGIDLNKCMGCNACIIGCQSENNIPIVGKEDVLKGREMHWIRLDRYFAGADPETPRAVGQPLACQHCENAPCEQVCPVAATIHSSEGINDMVYNRCVGTRYCANNCPYKVRRFNFFNYNKDLYDPKNDVKRLSKNPDVTIRARGVMEKCTFCIQRIKSTKQTIRLEKRELRDGDVVAACQQACPTNAITFGDLNDKNSEVSKAHLDLRSYALLEELNIKPRNLYLAEVRNPNPVLG